MTDLSDAHRGVLGRLARAGATPCYVYCLDQIREGASALRLALGDRFELSFAIKSNPNRALLRAMRPMVDGVDASSGGELERALAAGYGPGVMSFSGPAKREVELTRAVEIGCEVVCESLREIETLDALATRAGRRMTILIRICPTRVPAKFGVNMGGKASQFGIDEEALEGVLARRGEWRALDLAGFHIYSGTNALDEDAIAENFAIFCALFERFSTVSGIRARKLIFGSGFGVPLHDGQRALDLTRLGTLVAPLADRLRQTPATASARLVLETGRFLVGPHGWFLTSVVNVKDTRGKYLAICDGGLNSHLAACGLFGSVIRRNWMMWNVSPSSDAPTRPHQIVGPLCTTIDTLATDVMLPELRLGDALAVGASGAYGLSASPTHFISHPPAREFLYDRWTDDFVEISEDVVPLQTTVGT